MKIVSDQKMIDFDLNSPVNFGIKPIDTVRSRRRSYQQPTAEEDSSSGIKTFFHIIFILLQIGLIIAGLAS